MGTADGTVTESDDEGSRRVARRALLTGGAVVAGAVGAGAAMAATAGPASAATGDPVNVGETATATANAASTEIVATSSSNANPTLVLTNSGYTGNQASPPLRITPAASSSLYEPSTSTVGGDMVATYEGNLWFTHNNPGGNPIPATVHTDATSNSFMPLSAPYRVVDTRYSSSRGNILNASGNLDSTGRLLAGHTIHIDLTSLVTYGDAVTANLTVLGPMSNGWVLVWPGSGSKPEAASIAFSKGEAISNLTVSGIASYNGKTDTIAVTTSTTTQIVLDVAGFYVANFGQVNQTYAAFSSGTSSLSAVRASRMRTATQQ